MVLGLYKGEAEKHRYSLSHRGFGPTFGSHFWVTLLAQIVAAGRSTLFTPVSLAGHLDLKMMGLAPMAVLPAFQRMNFGSELVRTGLEQCRDFGFEAVVVLGHPEFYPRFGFLPSTRFGIDSEYGVPDEVFMVRELTSGALRGRAGRVTYHPAFSDV